MSDFSDSPWSDAGYSGEFIDNADIYVQERGKLLQLLGGYFSFFFGKRQRVRCLDLGAGDGVLSEAILRVRPTAEVTLLDGSQDMLLKADVRLGRYANVSYLHADFNALISGDTAPEPCDFIYSSFAIHHLDTASKRALYERIFTLLTPGGRFVNIETVKPESEGLHEWYFALWAQWIRMMQQRMQREGNLVEDVTRRYLDERVNKPDTLNMQIEMLREVGFTEVDCYYKNGIFAVFGGLRTE